MKNEVKLKQCTFCLQRKPATKTYFRMSYNNQGLESRCRVCQRKLSKKKNNQKEPVTTWMNGDSEIYV